MATVIVARRKSDGSQSVEHEEGRASPELMSAAEDLIRAVNSKSASDVAAALQNAYTICESYEKEPEE